MSDGDKRESSLDAAESETHGMRGRPTRENREAPVSSPPDGGGVRSEKAYGRTSEMHGTGESDRPIVPSNPPNKGVDMSSSAEGAEGRGLAKGNPRRQTRHRTQRRADLQQALLRIRQAARASLAASARYDPRQEPGAVIPHAGICAGGAP